MSTGEMSLDRLTFCDNDEVLVCRPEDGEQVWMLGQRALSRVIFHPDHIEFRLLDENGRDYEDEASADATRKYAIFRALGNISYSSAIQLENKKWFRNKTAVPTPEALEAFRVEELGGLSCNDFTLSIQRSNSGNGQFRLHEIMKLLAARKLPIGATPGYFFHDMNDHAVGMATLDESCANTLSALATMATDLRHEDARNAHQLAKSIARRLDYYTYYLYFKKLTATKPNDPLLTDILSLTVLPDTQKDTIRSIINDNGFVVDDDSQVLRSPEIRTHYGDVIHALRPHTIN